MLDQLETAGKGHKLAAVEALLRRLPLKGQVIFTGDALLAQHGTLSLPVDPAAAAVAQSVS